MAQPIWITPYNIGTFTPVNNVNTNVVAEPVYPAVNIVSYIKTNGTLPVGLSLTTTGFITGTLVENIESTYTFTIRATDNLGNQSSRSFQMSVSAIPNQPTWITSAGSLGTFPALLPLEVILEGSANLPATSVSFSLLSGNLPNGCTLSSSGIITGTPTLVAQETSSKFTIRLTDNEGNVRDRTFTMIVTGSASPVFTTPDGNILQSFDSIWIERAINYNNPNPNYPIKIKVIEGALPPGLEINENGLIRGYADPPVTNVTLPSVVTTATVTETDNLITCFSTTGFSVGRPVVFSGVSVFGGIQAGTIYYVKSISAGGGKFSISATQNGPTLLLTSGTGSMVVTLTPVSVGQPTIRTFSFNLRIESVAGSDTGSYSITIENQNYNNQNVSNTRLPVILNTRPRTYILTQADPYYGYYRLPSEAETSFANGTTYPINYPAPIGTIQSDNYFAFKMIGLDFDGDEITYEFANLPSWATGNTTTGWITGNPSLPLNNIIQFNFSVAVYKTNNPTFRSAYFSFGVVLTKNILNYIIWETDDYLGSIFNGTVSTKSVVADADVSLKYELVGGELPPNLTLLSNGEITGYVADQPTDVILETGTTSTFSFTVRAYSETYPLITSTKSFTLDVLQEYSQPTDTLYIKATPGIADRVLINSLLTNDTIIPPHTIYRPNDVYFGKASEVIYEHAYGIYASNIAEYLAAITENHYWRQITLGELATAVAKDENGIPVYEVVYSKVIDNLVNPEGISVNREIMWPRLIDLQNGPWYTSVTNTYTSYIDVLNQEYYTSLSPGYANTLYPNSLFNMRNRVGDVLGQEFDSRILPLWMTSQQADGNTLGYTQAWVICYTKPGFANSVKNRIETLWVDPATGDPYKLNKINFTIDKFSVNKTLTYNYNNNTNPASWIQLPSATPTPDPLNSKDFNVLFPRKTILPDDQAQY